MRKQNLLSKKIGKQILSINNLLENYFNRLRRFIIDIKKLRFDKDNKVFLVIVSIIFLTLVYFLIPTAYNKELIQKEIKIGDIKILPYELARPCSHLEQMVNGKHIIKEFLKRGGLRCEVLVSGTVKIGDEIKIL